MNSKKFTIIFLLLFVLISIFTYLLYYVVNPEQLFISSVTKYKYFYTKAYSRKQFETLKTQKSILVFGTSQTHMISSKMAKRDVLNFHNLYAEPGDILNFLKQLNNEQLKKIGSIVFLIDLRAGAIRVDTNLIDYNRSNIPILTFNGIKRIFLDFKKNYYKDPKFLNEDGSINSTNHHGHIKSISPYRNKAILKYDNRLIKGLVEINNYLKNKNIEIRFITPVVNDQYLKTMDLKKLTPFFEKLLLGGIDNIGIFYYIKGISDAKNDKLEYISFIEKDHLNYFYVQKWLFNYIFSKSEYSISNTNELKIYINKLEKIKEAKE